MPQFQNSTVRETASNSLAELAHEQAYLTMLYERLDVLKAVTQQRLAEVRLGPTAENDQGWSERESFAQLYQDRTAELDAAERNLCFGRPGLRRRRPVLHRPARPAQRRSRSAAGRLAGPRGGAVLPRHPAGAVWRDPPPPSAHRRPASREPGRRRARPGRRRRDPPDRRGRPAGVAAPRPDGADGRHRCHHPGRPGPHHSRGPARNSRRRGRAGHRENRGRAAPRRLPPLYAPKATGAARNSVIGPSATFLRYIDQVLPSLGENDVVLATIGSLFPGVEPAARNQRGPPGSKATRRWRAFWPKAVAALRQVPAAAIEIKVDGTAYRLTPRICGAGPRRSRAAPRSRHRRTAAAQRGPARVHQRGGAGAGPAGCAGPQRQRTGRR